MGINERIKGLILDFLDLIYLSLASHTPFLLYKGTEGWVNKNGGLQKHRKKEKIITNIHFCQSLVIVQSKIYDNSIIWILHIKPIIVNCF